MHAVTIAPAVLAVGLLHVPPPGDLPQPPPALPRDIGGTRTDYGLYEVAAHSKLTELPTLPPGMLLSK